LVGWAKGVGALRDCHHAAQSRGPHLIYQRKNHRLTTACNKLRSGQGVDAWSRLQDRLRELAGLNKERLRDLAPLWPINIHSTYDKVGSRSAKLFFPDKPYTQKQKSWATAIMSLLPAGRSIRELLKMAKPLRSPFPTRSCASPCGLAGPKTARDWQTQSFSQAVHERCSPINHLHPDPL